MTKTRDFVPDIGAEPAWWKVERGRLKFDPVILTPEQMRYAESVMPAICERGGWEHHTAPGRPDYVTT